MLHAFRIRNLACFIFPSILLFFYHTEASGSPLLHIPETSFSHANLPPDFPASRHKQISARSRPSIL